MSEDVLHARALLNRIAEPTSVPLWAYVRRVGPVEAVRNILAGTAGDDVQAATAGRLPTADPTADLEAADRYGIRLVVPESDDWPHFAFSCLERTGTIRAAQWAGGDRKVRLSGELVPPLALWVRGAADLRSLGTRSVGVVGARAATAYGEHVAADLSYGMALRGFVVVSGGAYGIDAAAHRGALGAGGETVLVSAGGLDRPYPPSNANLYERAAASGLVISESPPASAPHRRRFLTRNRLIAALSGGCVVVEAAVRSGAMNTAGHARNLGRPLMAVPGPVTSPMSAGCHDLLRPEPPQQAACLVAGVDDVLAVIGTAGDLPAERDRTAGRAPLQAALDDLDDDARRLYDGLPARRPISPDDLAATAGVAPLTVIRSLPALELAGLVAVAGDGIRRLPPPTAGRSGG